jgi:hypothetical protein
LVVLERLKHNFRLLLSAFDGVVCPLCDVRARLETPEVERLHARGDLNAALCATHLGSYFGCTDDRSTRARVTRRIIETIIAGRPACQVCEYLSRVEERLARAIRRLDNRMRFRKALEMAPLFCQRHINLVVSDPLAVNFVEIQAAKLRHLRDDLAQAEILNRESLEPLTLSAIAYLGGPVPEQPVLQLQDSADTSAAEASEFEKWDDELQLRHLGKLESEAASLRYRNATLSEENRRLKAARVASEATRRDLERDLAQLLATAEQRDSNPQKSSSRQP